MASEVFNFVKEKFYPNPLKSGEEIFLLYDLKDNTDVEIIIYTMDGRVAEKIEKKDISGAGKINFYPKKFAPGVYFYQVIKHCNNKTEKSKIQKLIIIK